LACTINRKIIQAGNDNKDTYTAAARDAMNYHIVTGSTGISISISFIEVYGNATQAAAATGPTYRHFDNTPRRLLGRQNYNPFGDGQSDGDIWIVGDVINPVASLLISASL